MWTKEEALEELERLVRACDGLRGSSRYSPEHTRWFTNAIQFLGEVFGPNSLYRENLRILSFQEMGPVAYRGYDPAPALERANQRAFVRDLGTANGLLQAARDELTRREIVDVYDGKNTGPEASGLMKVLSIAEKKLRKVIRGVPAKERDVQDAVESLLLGAEVTYSRETDSIEYSSKTYVPDFTLAQLDLALEIKLCNRPEREKEVIAEINDDILAYGTKYGNQLFIIYDCGFIRDIDRFSENFEAVAGVLIRVVKH